MKVLFTPYGGGSIAHMIRSLAIADEMKKRGHTILFTAPETKKHLITRAGYDVYGKGHAEVNLNDESDQSITYFKKNHELFINWLGDEIAAAESFKPDIIVNSPSFFGPLAAMKLDIPYASIINAPWLLEFKGILGMSKSEHHWSHRVIRRLAKPIFVRSFERLYMQEIQSFYSRLGISQIPQRRVDLHSGNPALIPGIPEFEPIEQTSRTDIHYVGPLFWQGFEKESFDPTHFFSELKKPLVYVSLGGSIFRKQSYKELIDSLMKKRDWNILLSIGPNFKREEFPQDTSHMAIRSFVPGLQTCKFADLIINTGSHGTVMQALWYGKPVIAIPHNIDQATISSRLEELQIGINLNRIGLRDFTHREKYFRRATQLSWDRIIQAADDALKNPSLLKSAHAFKTKLRAYDHAEKKAADYIEHYAQRSK